MAEDTTITIDTINTLRSRLVDKLSKTDNITTFRRRLVDKLCKDDKFAIEVISYAIRKGKIRYIDLMTEETAKLLAITNWKGENNVN